MRVMLESPFSGDVERNLRYARRALKDSLNRGEAPFASHLLYPQVLEDSVVTDRAAGLASAFEWLSVADGVVVYKDYGVSPGMRQAIRRAQKAGKFISYRTIGVNPQ